GGAGGADASNGSGGTAPGGGGGGGGDRSGGSEKGGNGAEGKAKLTETLPGGTATIILQVDDGSGGGFSGWTTAATIISAGTATTATRARSSSFVPIAGRNYRIVAYKDANATSYDIYNAKIVVQQSGGNLLASSYSESNYTNVLYLSSAQTFQGAGQSFIGNGGTLSSAKFYSYKWNSPTGNAYAKVYAHAFDYGSSSKPTGSALATSDALDVSSIPSTNTLIEFIFSGVNSIVLQNGTYYVVTIEYNGGDISNYIYAFDDETSPTHSGNLSSLSSSSWSSYSGYDLIFYVYTSDSLPTLLEPQYLLLNTKSTATGLQSFNTLFDPGEWSGVTNTYKHAQDAIGSTANSQLKDIDNSNAILTNSSITGANQTIGSNITDMPTSAHMLDTDIVTVGTEIDASRILVQVTPVPENPWLLFGSLPFISFLLLKFKGRRRKK
ncbi:MAG: hypothetical protein Q8P25_04155, partial [Candidatus Curtissbacteria bacterium]|nr:hypothetical protein [Candidatus Curtissbacteria bacterium]